MLNPDPPSSNSPPPTPTVADTAVKLAPTPKPAPRAQAEPVLRSNATPRKNAPSWTSKEDVALKAFMRAPSGSRDWTSFGAGLAHQRTERACQERWQKLTKEDPSLKVKRPGAMVKVIRWTPADDVEILRLRSEKKGWTEISGNFHQRSAASCKYRWLLLNGKVTGRRQPRSSPRESSEDGDSAKLQSDVGGNTEVLDEEAPSSPDGAAKVIQSEASGSKGRAGDAPLPPGHFEEHATTPGAGSTPRWIPPFDARVPLPSA